jgi:DNA-binding NarL/FixJ family response regulator
MDKRIKVLLVEDDNDFVYLIKKEIEKDDKLEYIGYASNKALGVAMARKHNPAVVVMDLNLSGSELDGIDAAKEIRLTTGAKILLLTSFEQPDIVIDAAKKAFASGYIFKSQCSTLLTDTIYKTAKSKTPQELFIKELLLGELTSAERGVLNDLIAGNINAAASSSLKTIANQKTSIFKKLGLKNTDELFAVFRDW